MNVIKYGLFLFLVLGIFSCKSDPPNIGGPSSVKKQVPKTLPMKSLSLANLEEFEGNGGNWTIGGAVYSDWQKEGGLNKESGTGILVNVPTEQEKTNITTSWEHGDLDLEITFLVPKGSNSGIYFQGRYELQILDSWGKPTVNYGDLGGIYERWDDTKPKGEEGYEGVTPKANAAKAPGLWQHFKVEFRAPRFDKKGKKIQKARFKKVYLNGYLIHDDVELTGPTRGGLKGEEVAEAALMIQGDHGPVAFKDIKYKSYGLEQLALTNITYEFFDGKSDKLPDFSQLKAQKSGNVDTLDVFTTSDQADGYRLRFKGDLQVPNAGTYLFTTRIDDGGELLIDGKSVVYNEGDPGYGVERGFIDLAKGNHQFEMTYYQEIWGRSLVIDYEGPNIIQQSLAKKIIKNSRSKPRPPILIANPLQAELIRGFVNHNEEKKTNILSVGDPKGVHYSYDLRNGNLIKAWKGKFADVTEMWQGRGNAQLLKPLNASIDLTGGRLLAELSREDASWPEFIPDDYKLKGYQLDEAGQPVFLTTYKGNSFKDRIRPTTDGKSLERIIEKEGTSNPFYARIASGETVKQLSNGLISVDGQYYLEGEKLMLRNNKEVLVKLENKVAYKIHW